MTVWVAQPLTSNGGTLTATGYNFQSDQGLSLSGVSTGNSYSIEMGITLDMTTLGNFTGYVKLIDFQNKTSDNGLYSNGNHQHNGGALDFYTTASNTEAPSPSIIAGTEFVLLFTRDSSGNVAAYINGVEQISFKDTLNATIFGAGNGILNFLQDDNVTNGFESDPGSIDYIKIFNSNSTAVNLSSTVVPEPSSAVLMGIGALVFAAGVYRRRQIECVS